MAEFDISAATHGYQKRVQLALSDTAMHELLVCASDTSIVIDSMYVANSSAGIVPVTVDCYDDSTSTYVDTLSEGGVLAKCSLVVIDNDSPVYLEEGDKLRVQAGTGGVLSVTVSYRVMS